jgi:hypothetical protein
VLVVCPINPFEWPVKASLGKFVARGLTGAYKEKATTVLSISTIRVQPRIGAYKQYLTAIGNAVDAFQ